MTMCYLNIGSVISPYRLSVDTAEKIIYWSNSSTSDESLHSLSPWEPKKDNNGLVFAPSCNGPCFLRQAECDHRDCQEVTLNRVGDYIVFPSMWYHHGFFSVKPKKTIIQAQLFAMNSPNPAQDRLTRQTTKWLICCRVG